MIRLAKKSRRSIKDIRERAIEFFGPKGLGMRVEDSDPSALSFTGSGGEVNIVIKPEKGFNSVEVMSQEWDYQAQQFLEEKL